MRFKTRFEAALYVWDYFYVARYPAQGDEKPWAMIERATGRIRESEGYLRPDRPADVRLQHARRLWRAARVAKRHIEQLSTATEQWVLDELDTLESFARTVLDEVAGSASELVVD